MEHEWSLSNILYNLQCVLRCLYVMFYPPCVHSSQFTHFPNIHTFCFLQYTAVFLWNTSLIWLAMEVSFYCLSNPYIYLILHFNMIHSWIFNISMSEMFFLSSELTCFCLNPPPPPPPTLQQQLTLPVTLIFIHSLFTYKLVSSGVSGLLLPMWEVPVCILAWRPVILRISVIFISTSSKMPW